MSEKNLSSLKIDVAEIMDLPSVEILESWESNRQKLQVCCIGVCNGKQDLYKGIDSVK